MCIYVQICQIATEAAHALWTAQWKRQVMEPADSVPFREVDRTRWALLCLGAAPDRGPVGPVFFPLLARALRSSSCTRPWERRMRSGLALRSDSW